MNDVGRPSLYEQDGVMGIYELQTFPKLVITGAREQAIVQIPRPIQEHLAIKGGDIIEIAIRKIDEEECQDKYGFIPQGRPEYGELNNIDECPKCGKSGTIHIHLSDERLEVYHGWDEKNCYIGSFRRVEILYPEIYEKAKQMVAQKHQQEASDD